MQKSTHTVAIGPKQKIVNGLEVSDNSAYICIINMELASSQINLISDFFSKQPVLKAYLFGSYGRGEGTAESDIDLLVELDYSQPIGLEFIQMQIDLQKLLSKKVDLVSARGLSKFIKPMIDKEKKLIYAR